jgi:uncharacterized protein
MIEVIGYVVTVLVGVSLGLIGGGGSIFTIPVLVYLFQVPALEATSYSHFMVGVTAVFASVSYFRNRLIHFPTLIFLGIPSMISVYVSRVWLLPKFPDTFHFAGVNVSEDLFILILFSIMMITASYSMIRKCETCAKDGDDSQIKFNYPLIILSGFGVGILTGIVGAGGGFLLIPAMVFFARLPMKKAIGTSLLIIAIKSLIGFSSEIGLMTFNWPLLLSITALSILGMLLGTYLNKKVQGEKLKPAFGWFILLMGMFMLVVELRSIQW